MIRQPHGAYAFFMKFLDGTETQHLDEWSARRRDLYLTTHKKHSEEKDIQAPGWIRTRNKTIERPQTHTSDRAATETGSLKYYACEIYVAEGSCCGLLQGKGSRDEWGDIQTRIHVNKNQECYPFFRVVLVSGS
jgi:hypothetical protein